MKPLASDLATVRAPALDPVVPPLAEIPDLEGSSAREVLEYAVERFHPRLYVAVSFQKESSVMVDMLLDIEPSARFFTIDTDVLFGETYETWKQFEEHFDIQLDVYKGMSLARQASLRGDELWKTDPDACCGIRKVTPMKEALSHVDCWATGVRRDQAHTRKSVSKLHWDRAHGLWKINPLADWSEKDVWNHISQRGLPYNELHDRGYASIGCTHCTKPGTGRDGRWSESAKTECGIHG
ncbi:MAG: phosphoadenosine phosphosulfate reductase [Thermoleophilaceae bacterium]|nr:phosphoadenosine phosphosulfate reductase [Thermoleophilaceae bacterium]